jgi:hypothetical protein
MRSGFSTAELLYPFTKARAKSASKLPNAKANKKVVSAHQQAVQDAIANSVPNYPDVVTEAVDSGDTGDIVDNLDPKPGLLLPALIGLYTMARSLGAMDGAKLTGGDPIQGDNGNAVLDNAPTMADNITNTTASTVGTVITSGVTDGQSASDINSTVNDVLNSEQRANMITLTEANRGYNTGVLDQLIASGETTFEWITYDGACAECLALEGTHPVGDDTPPLHPNCQCAIGLSGSTD